MYEHEHPAYSKLGQIGREITSKVKPSAVVVFSAHWQGGKDTVLVNTAEITDLIYEYVNTDPSTCLLRSTANYMIASTASRITIIKRNIPMSGTRKLRTKSCMRSRKQISKLRV